MNCIKRVWSHMAWLSGAVLLSTMLSQSLQAGFADQIRFECEAVVDVFGEPKLGEPFEVEFRFTPLAEIKHERGVLDTAYLRVREEGVSYVSGDTLWVGRLEQGQSYSMRATFVCDAEVRFRVKGSIRAWEVMGLIGPPGATTAAHSGKSSRLLDFRIDPPPDGFSFESYIVVSNDSGEPVLMPTPDSLRHVVDRDEFHRRRRERLESQGSVYGLPRTRPSGGEKQQKTLRTNKVTLTLEKLHSLDTILLYRKGFNLIKLGHQIQNLRILNDSSFRLDRSGSGAFRLDVLRPDTALEIQLGDSTYVLPVKFISQWELSGVVSYVDINSSIQPAEWVVVDLCEWDDEWGMYFFTQSENTSLAGGFSFFVESSQAELYVYSENDALAIQYDSDHRFLREGPIFSGIIGK